MHCQDAYGIGLLEEHMRDIPVMWLPQCILDLMTLQRWRTILLPFEPGHVAARKVHAGCIAWLQKVLGWPREADLHAPLGGSGPKPERPLDEQSVLFLIDVLRQSRDSILAELNSDPCISEGENTYLQMERALKGLQLLARSFGSKPNVGKTSAKSGEDLINALRAAQHVRNRSKLQQLQKLMLENFLPDELQGLARSVMKNLPAGASISRHQVGC